MSTSEQESRIAFVTGASRGVGRGIALGLAGAGWDVCVNYHADEAGIEETAASIRELGRKAWVYKADVGDREQVVAMMTDAERTAGPIGLVVNNAGVQTWAPLLELAEEDWDRTIRTNLKGAFLGTQTAGNLMKDRGGRIINIGSGANMHPFPNLIDYCASKGGIETFTTVAAVELGRYGITVNCVAPGCIEIERTRREDPTYADTWAALTPVGRIGTVEDVAAAVVFLASEQAAFITGQTLMVDGGLWSQVPWPYKSR